MKVTGQCDKCEGYPPKGPFVPVSFLYLLYMLVSFYLVCFFHTFCTLHLSYFSSTLILFFSELQLDPAVDQRRKKSTKIGSQSIFGIYSRGRKAVREEVPEIESGHFSDLRRQQTVWIRSNWLIRAEGIPR